MPPVLVTRELRSAVVVAVPEAAPAVESWLEATAGAKPSHGVPPHVTVLFPFVLAARIDTVVLDAVRSLARRHEPFPFELRELRRWPDVLYLAPEPANAFAELTEAFVAAYPEFPPYEGAHATVVPHLTVAQGDPAVLDDAENDVGRSLPLRAHAHELTLLAERAPDAWETLARVPLGGAA